MSVAGRTRVRRFWRVELVALCFASVWSVAFMVAAWVVPVYTSQTSEQDDAGRVITHSGVATTLIQQNGPIAAGFVAIPLLITIAVWTIFGSRTVARRPGLAAWALAGLVGLCSLLGAFTVGPLILPVAAALLAACGVRTARASSA